MKAYLPHILLVLIIAYSSFIAAGNSFALTNQNDTQTSTAGYTATGKDTYTKGITAGRGKALVGGVMGLLSVIIGWQAKRRAAKNNSNTRIAAVVALVLGLIASILSIIHLGTSAGAVFGSGSGKAGAIVALLLGTSGAILSILALRKNK